MTSPLYIIIWKIILLLSTGTLFRLHHALELSPSISIVEKFAGTDFDIQCSGSSGSNDLNWYDKNGDLVNLRKGNVLSHKREKTVMLTFNNITMNNGGKYICAGKERGENTKAYFELSVILPITFKPQPTVFYREEGERVMLQCELTADKRTEIVWKHNNQSIEGERYQIVDEHSLVIKNVTEQDFGDYTCNAYLNTEQLSETRKLMFSLKQARKPIIVSETDDVEGELNKTIEVECQAHGEPPAEINWYRNNQKVILELGTEMIQRANASILKISSVDSRHFGEYVCIAKNEVGNDTKLFHLKQAIAPAEPTVEVQDVYSTSVQLHIMSKQETSKNLYYKFNYAESQNGTTNPPEQWNFIDLEYHSPAQTEPYSIDHLKPNTIYIYQVGACAKQICTFTPIYTFLTPQQHTSKACNLYVPYIDILIIPTLFTIICIIF